MIKSEVTPQRKTLQSSYEINQEIQENRVLTDKSKPVRKRITLKYYKKINIPSITKGRFQ